MMIMQFTVRAKIHDPSVYPVLKQMGQNLSRLRRTLFVKNAVQGKSITELKREFIANEGITARQFNSLAYEVKGLVSAYREQKKFLIQKTKKKIQKLRTKIKTEKDPFKLHQHKRKLVSLELRLSRYKQELDHPSICFGGRKLFNKQFHLKENGYSSLQDWKDDWQSERDSQFFLIGSKDESFGNQSSQLLPGKLKLRLTSDLAIKPGCNHVDIPVQFTYQQDRIALALASHQAIHYRFIRNKNGWYVHATFDIPAMALVSNSRYGALGIDLNPSCIAVTHIDSFGNLKTSWQVPLTLRGKTSEQIQAILGDEIAKLVQYAKSNQIPIVIEELDFENKKLELRSRRMNRMLSQFAYSAFANGIKAKCFKEGIELIQVNPAYTSVIGKVKFSLGYGLSTHMGAAMAIGRRGLSFGEQLRAKTKVRLQLPVRNRLKHVWSDWRLLNPRVFSEEYIFREDRQYPEYTQGEKASRSTRHDLTRTRKDFGGEVILH